MHSNRWKQPALEQAAGDFLKKKFDSGDPMRMYAAFRIWNGYLLAREPANCVKYSYRIIHFPFWLEPSLFIMPDFVIDSI